MRLALLAAALAAFAFTAVAETQAVTQSTAAQAADDDPFLWLEEIHGARALAWVEKENARSLALLKADPRYEAFHAAALKILNAEDRIPAPELIGSVVYNFWQDGAHVRGVWRRASPASYAQAEPAWETVLDLDALSGAENANWVWKGANCPPPDYRRCLVQLSDGGEDAVSVREFDLGSKAFVAGGFSLARGKQTADWLDDDTLIVARDWGAGTTTASGYPFVVKTLRRGENLGQAKEVFRGTAEDVSVDPGVLHDGDGHRLALIVRATDFFHAEYYRLTDRGVERLALPQKTDVHGLAAGQLIFSVLEDWSFGGRAFKAGSLVAASPDALAGSAPAPPPALLFEPGPRQSVEQTAVSAHHVVAAIYDNVRGGLSVFTPEAGGWGRSQAPTAANASVGIAAVSLAGDDIYYSVESFLEPTRLWRARAGGEAATVVKALPARFDASGDVVDQHEAVSSDGAKIPYFVVHPKDMALDGGAPTLLYAYGGFQVSELPTYSAVVGKLWLERGGTYVLANIRGGGEFGPAWHEAGLKTRRQRVFDDFAAVAKDLIARKITSPRRLGAQGGSNGGLLMGVELVQHPELWRAVDIEVPLLDMLRFEKIGAGASWVGEYGSVANREERDFLASISPYRNLRAGALYPEPFFVTSTKDDRVTPVHARKMAARMQALGLPFLYFENTNGGHAASANLMERAERAALEYAYLARKLMD
ncbi:MAG: S9 family peptidase [Caulobacteraceae bacterium]|nr:S9 family peptidase [Caulobacteraceae bacterium]